MAIHHRLGLREGAGLVDDEIQTVLAAMGVARVTERIDGRLYDLTVDGSILIREPADEGIVDLAARLYDEPPGSAAADEVSYASLCVLVPGSTRPEFHAARPIEGVPGWTFEDLDVAYARLKTEMATLGHTAEPLTLSHLRRASSLGVAVVFGKRAR